MADIPLTMKTWSLQSGILHDKLSDASFIAKCASLQQDVPLPVIKDGQVLVQVARGTINPNDLLHAKGEYSQSSHIAFPRPVGFEGAGKVVASKAPFYLPAKVNANVAFYAPQGGMFGEYVVADAMSVIPIPNGVSFSDAACSVVNPLTAICMVDHAKYLGHKSFVHTAAASALGKLILKYAKTQNVEVICVVRRDEQVQACQDLGAKHIVKSTDENFEEQLKQAVDATNCRFCYECVSGSLATQILRLLPKQSVLVSYGNLSGEPIAVMDSDLVPQKEIHSFIVSDYMDGLWIWQKLSVIRKLTNGMGSHFASEIQKSFPLEELPQAYAYYSDNMSKGKVQIVVNDSL